MIGVKGEIWDKIQNCEKNFARAIENEWRR
jgi:hypothetical protein